MGSESVTSAEGRRTRTRGTGHKIRNSRPKAGKPSKVKKLVL